MRAIAELDFEVKDGLKLAKGKLKVAEGYLSSHAGVNQMYVVGSQAPLVASSLAHARARLFNILQFLGLSTGTSEFAGMVRLEEARGSVTD
jgi:hypothetical protein